MLFDFIKDSNNSKRISAFFKGAAWSCLVLMVITGCLVILSWLQLQIYAPQNITILNDKIQSLEQNTELDQSTILKEEIRTIDLLARKGYLTKQWQVVAGGVFLLITFLFYLASSWIVYLINRKSPSAPPAAGFFNHLNEHKKARLITGAFLLLIPLLFVLMVFKPALFLTYQKKNGNSLQTFAGKKQDINFFKQNWPSFRGPFNNSIAFTKSPPVQWNEDSGKGIAWKIPIPMHGFNSPVLWKDKIFLSGADNKKQEVYCINAADGRMLWQMEVPRKQTTAKQKYKVSENTGYAASTMATDGTAVVVLFGSGDMASFDFDGKLLWTLNLGVPQMNYGFGSSLIAYSGKVFIQFDQEKDAALIAVNILTGKTLWKSKREIITSWASPSLVITDSQNQIVLNSNPIVSGYDINSGKELWSVECMKGEVAPSLAFDGNTIFATTQYAVLAAIDFSTKQLTWEYYDDLPDVSSPVAANGLVFLASNSGVVSCIDSSSGNLVWKQEYDTGFYASPVIADNNLYLLDKNGTMHIVKASNFFESVADSVINEPCVSTPAFADSSIYIRSDKHLYCIGVVDEK